VIRVPSGVLLLKGESALDGIVISVAVRRDAWNRLSTAALLTFAFCKVLVSVESDWDWDWGGWGWGWGFFPLPFGLLTNLEMIKSCMRFNERNV